MYEREAKERQKRKPKSVVQNSAQQNGQKSRDAAGAAVGVSGYSVDAATKVLKKGAVELQKAVDKGTIKVSTASRLAEAPRKTRRSAARSGPKGVRVAIEQHAPTPGALRVVTILARPPPQ